MGRTGTFIALDITLDQMSAEKTVDIKGTVQRMREKRMNMIQTVVCEQSHACTPTHTIAPGALSRVLYYNFEQLELAF